MAPERLDLASLPQRSRFYAWQALAEPFFDVSRPGSGVEDFEVAMLTQAVGDALLIETSVSGLVYDHSRRHAVSGGWDQVAFQIYLEGSFKGDYAGVPVEVFAGDINVIDFTKPYIKQSSDEQDINLIVPRRIVERVWPAFHHGAVLNAHDRLTRLAGLHLRSMASHASRFSIDEARASLEAFLLIMAGGRAKHVDITPGAVDFARSTARVAATRFIDRHLLQPGLNAERVCRDCGISRATLYRAFAFDGGVKTYISRQRLTLAYRLLREEKESAIQDIAERCGFEDPAMFTRQFRATFGLSPRETRDALAPQPAQVRRSEEWIDAVRRFGAECR